MFLFDCCCVYLSVIGVDFFEVEGGDCELYIGVCVCEVEVMG